MSSPADNVGSWGLDGRDIVLRRELNDSARAYQEVNDKETGWDDASDSIVQCGR
jgi:hypothetical protein